MADNLENLLRDLALQDSGFHRHENLETGVTAYFPKTAENVEEWEARCAAMHEQQRMVIPEPKPEPNTLAERKHRKIGRGD